MKKQFIAKVFRQDTPMANGCRFKVENGDIYPDHTANLVPVGHVSGTGDECWEAAFKLTRHPVLEFKEVRHGNA